MPSRPGLLAMRRRPYLPAAAFLAVGLGATGCDGCRGEPVAAAPTPTLPPYPVCPEPTSDSPAVVEAEGTLRPGPYLRERRILEDYQVSRRGCHRVTTVRRLSPIDVVDVEVVYDLETGRPLRAWRRTALRQAPDRPTFDVFDFQGEPGVHLRRLADGTVERRALDGPAPTAVVGPGRGILTVWIRDAGLAVGERDRRVVLDLTGAGELDDEGTLWRAPNRTEAPLGTVEVYRVYGRDAVFTSADGRVVGDLAGLRRAADVDAPPVEPPPGLETPTPREVPGASARGSRQGY